MAQRHLLAADAAAHGDPSLEGRPAGASLIAADARNRHVSDCLLPTDQTLTEVLTDDLEQPLVKLVTARRAELIFRTSNAWIRLLHGGRRLELELELPYSAR